MIYKGTCSCGETYIGEAICNTSIRWEEHNDPTKNSELAKHLKINFHHVFNWITLRNLEASYTASLKPTLNEQNVFEILTLLRNGVT